ncbi:uncharacterized protein LOC131940804 isoform X2 [Physella acuta]|uniref:uncharacterized protein LOC131940804 isoform X2 n=1 Tax=Physella acuta TaxID=109671 RepID=UPI0027DB6BAA|nr:uncharacterized protein LOC131940804 isoform X2 [Physella acuta]
MEEQNFMNMDPECERPRNYEEAVSGEVSWDNYGFRIKWTEPEVPGEFRNPCNEPLRLRLCVETKTSLQVPPDDITAWCWTNMRFDGNPYGIWKEINLENLPKCTQWDDHGINSYVFQSYVVPTMNNNYRLTFNVKFGKIMIWANKFQVDNILDILQKPAVGTQNADDEQELRKQMSIVESVKNFATESPKTAPSVKSVHSNAESVKNAPSVKSVHSKAETVKSVHSSIQSKTQSKASLNQDGEPPAEEEVEVVLMG